VDATLQRVRTRDLADEALPVVSTQAFGAEVIKTLMALDEAAP
jgi:hypothetical protein